MEMIAAVARAADTAVNQRVRFPLSTRVVMPGWTVDSDELAAGELATVAIGGTFTSRLNRLLREEKGYTYGARASYGGKSNYG